MHFEYPWYRGGSSLKFDVRKKSISYFGKKKYTILDSKESFWKKTVAFSLKIRQSKFSKVAVPIVIVNKNISNF